MSTGHSQRRHLCRVQLLLERITTTCGQVRTGTSSTHRIWRQRKLIRTNARVSLLTTCSMAASVLAPQTSHFPQQQDLYTSGLYAQYQGNYHSSYLQMAALKPVEQHEPQSSPHQHYGFTQHDHLPTYDTQQRWVLPQAYQHKSSKSPGRRDRTPIYHKRPESTRVRSTSMRDSVLLAYATEQSLQRQQSQPQSQPQQTPSNSTSPEQVRQVMHDTTNGSANVYGAQMPPPPPPSSAYTNPQYITPSAPSPYIHPQPFYNQLHAQPGFQAVSNQEGPTPQEMFGTSRSELQLPAVASTTLNPHDTVYQHGRASQLPPMAQVPMNFPPISQPLESTQNDVDVSGARQKPQCWDHGCNGRQFSTFSNLLRHQREKNGQANKAKCPHCGAEFTRTTARNGHLYGGKCKGMPDMAKKGVTTSPELKPPIS